MATGLTYLPHLKTDAEHKAEERQSEHQQKLRDAAPELLEALVILLNDAKHMAENGDMSSERESFAIARAAIAKAKP